MANSTSNVSDFVQDNLETYSLIWLDAQVNRTDDNILAQKRLREIINHLKTFEDRDQCQHYISRLSSQDRIILIISGRSGRKLIPKIHQLRQIASIYIYCYDKNAYEQWAKDFSKIKSIIVQLNDLIVQIKNDQNIRKKIEDPLSINVFTIDNTNIINSDQSTTTLNGHFVHFRLLIDVLLRMKSIETDKQQLIEICRNAYNGNSAELSMIQEFESKYDSDNALWWYTRDSFLHKMLNKALRIQNVDLLFLFRFFINDIYQQLKKHQCSSCVRVYRGQIMSNEELNTLQRSIGDYISINSFFSTSIYREKALEFLNRFPVANNSYRVLFIINADPLLVKNRPFANISQFSQFVDEFEVLFMVGCVFLLENVYHDVLEQLWIIQIKLCGDDQHDLKRLFDFMKKESGGDGEINLHSYGLVLRKMGKFNQAEKMLRRSLIELPQNDSMRYKVYWALGIVAFDKGEYESSHSWFNQSLKIKLQIDPLNYISIGNLYNWIGETHRMRGNYTVALEYYHRAIKLFRDANKEDHLDMAWFYNNIAIIHRTDKKFSVALEFYEKSLNIREKHLPIDHPDLASSHYNIGSLYFSQKQYDRAMDHHVRSLKMRLKSLPPQHTAIAHSYKSIGDVYEAINELKQALDYYRKAADIIQHSLSSQHPDRIRIEHDINRIVLMLK